MEADESAVENDTGWTKGPPYIDAHPIEYREMIYYGNYTLQYCFALLEQGNQTGLEGHHGRGVPQGLRRRRY